jgi:hypothetical protein
MLKRLGNCLAILAMLALASPVFAKTFSQTLDLTQPAKLGDTSLQPGHYKVMADLGSDQVQVEQNGKLVATATGKTVDLNNKSAYNAVVFNGRHIQEIQISGKMQAIELPSS